jgi:hypothetical protein
MPEANAGSDVDPLSILGRGERAPLDAEPVSGAPYDRRVTDRLGGGEQQEPSGCLGKLTGAPEVVILDVARKICGRE